MRQLILLIFSIPIVLLISVLVYGQQSQDLVNTNGDNTIHSAKIGNVSPEFIGTNETHPNLTLNDKLNYTGSGFGLRFGLGTDITLGFGFGLGAFYVRAPSPYSSTNLDIGLDIYYANVSEDEVDYEGTKFEDNTKLLVFALRANGLFNYHPRKMGVYFVAGAGIVAASVSWKETITYGPIYGNVIEPYSADAFALGNVLNLGVGLTFGSGMEARFETPLLIFYSTPGHGSRSAGSIAPTFTLSVLYRLP